MTKDTKSNNLPVLPLSNIVVFPNMVVPLFVGRDKSINALEQVMDNDQELLFLSQKNSEVDDPSENDLYKIGTKGKILQLLKLPDGTVKVLVEGKTRCKVKKIKFAEDFVNAEIEEITKNETISDTIKALGRSVASKYETYANINNKTSSETLTSVKDIENEDKLADTVASQIAINIQEKQNLKKIASNVLGNYGRIFAEYVHLKDFRNDKLKKYISIEGLDHLNDLKQSKITVSGIEDVPGVASKITSPSIV